MLHQKTYFKTIGTIFTVIAGLHLLRILNAWPAQIGSFQIPMWFSWIAVIVTAWLAYQSFKFRK